MAVDTREDGAASATSDPSRQLPKGTVLGKDGKPCRTCSSLKSFTASTRKAKVLAPILYPVDCPPDVEALGRSSWTLLHSITATYPITPSASQQSDVKTFLGLFGKLYPCWVCAEDFQRYMEENKVRTSSREEFGRWMCEAHNDVNKKLGKKEFDCNKWDERWRTGWKDGRCD